VSLPSKKIVHVSLPTSARAKNPLLDYGNKAYISWDKTDGVILKS
jgi:hypothetical protein